MDAERAAIVQGDRSVLLEVDHPGYEAARDALARFAEIEKSPEHVHTYRISDLSLWNAAATGMGAEEVIEALSAISRFALPEHVCHEIRDQMQRYGLCSLHLVTGDPQHLRLRVAEPLVRERLGADAKLADLMRPAPDGFLLQTRYRGAIKQALLKLGYPVTDEAGLQPGEPLPVALRDERFTPYDYQRQAARAFVDSGGHGVVALPCGAGKTIVAMVAMEALQTRTMILTSGKEACQQWRRELLDKTQLSEEQVCIYDSRKKTTAAVTLTTYHLFARKGGGGATGHVHFDRLAGEPWGLVVYDEVHLLPAPIFRLTAELQARRRLGLTATLVREDGRAGDVFALIGPKRFDMPWRQLEASGHIAAATCIELRVPLCETLRTPYAVAPLREQPRVAAENPLKLRALRDLVERHPGERVLVIGSYLEPLEAAGALLDAPVVTGKTAHRERERCYADFRSGKLRRLVLSRVGNFAIDLPEANVLVQISGTMGSRQEEAQRLGRVLRPKPGGALFYSIVTRDTVDQKHALHRQLFLTEQGYRYYIEDWDADDAPTGRPPQLH
ncbi:MAG: DEAD/DEAH box helicase [Myxococcales bacterium]|nr:DEAD/DEAH box helicase [Myxococcales bacterium]